MNIKHSLLTLAALLTLAPLAHAQGGFGGGGFGGPGGGPPMSPAMMQKMQAWRTWRDNHKNVVSLGRTLGALADMGQDPRTAFTKPQAKAMLAVIHKWQGKPALSDEQARQVNSQITAPLTLMQIKQIAVASQRRPGGSGGGGFGGGRPGGGGGFGGGGRPGFDPASFPAPREYNPLNPATSPMPRGRERAQQRHAQLMAELTAAAK